MEDRFGVTTTTERRIDEDAHGRVCIRGNQRVRDFCAKDRDVSECAALGLARGIFFHENPFFCVVRHEAGEQQVMEGPAFSEQVGNLVPGRKGDFDRLENVENFDRLIGSLKVLARARPEDKYKLVRGLMMLGHKVAVVGDGTNDAPALSIANVGICPGISGTEVARNASGALLLGDDFSSVPTLLLWGRWFAQAAAASLEYRLTVRLFVGLATAFSAAVFHEAVFSCTQVLWILGLSEAAELVSVKLQSPRLRDLQTGPPRLAGSLFSQRSAKKVLAGALLCAGVIAAFAPKGLVLLGASGEGPDSSRLARFGSEPRPTPCEKEPSEHFAAMFHASCLIVLFLLFSIKARTAGPFPKQAGAFFAFLLVPGVLVQLAAQHYLSGLLRLPNRSLGATAWLASFVLAFAAFFLHQGLMVAFQEPVTRIADTLDHTVQAPTESDGSF